MRAMRTNALLFAAALCAAAASAAQAAKVVVTGDRVNLRAAAQGESEVVAQLSFGEELELHGSPADPWVAVAVPERCDVWISSPFLTGDEVNVRIVSADYEEYDAAALNVFYPVMPSQGSCSKSDTGKRPFKKNEAVYRTDAFYTSQPEVVTARKIGTMRDVNLASVVVSPVAYNPVTDKIRVYSRIEVEIHLGDEGQVLQPAVPRRQGGRHQPDGHAQRVQHHPRQVSDYRPRYVRQQRATDGFRQLEKAHRLPRGSRLHERHRHHDHGHQELYPVRVHQCHGREPGAHLCPARRRCRTDTRFHGHSEP